MNLKRVASNLLEEAELRLMTAGSALENEGWSYCVRQSQECVELSLKSCLRLLGIEYPKEHDVGQVMKAERERFPEEFRKKLDKISKISRELAEKRVPAMYGDEEKGLTPIELFKKDDAEKAFKDANQVFTSCKELIKNW